MVKKYIITKSRRRPLHGRYRRRRSKKGASGPNAIVAMIKGINPFPDRLMCKMRYDATLYRSIGAGVTDKYQMSGNSVFKPDVTGGALQPPFFDDLIGIYSSFRVLGSKITIRFLNNKSGSALQVALCPTRIDTTPTSIDDLANYRHGQTRFVSAGGDPKLLKYYINTATIQGISRNAVMSQATYVGDATTGPSKEWFWHIAAIDGSGLAYTYAFQVQVTYYVSWEKGNFEERN